MTLDWIYEGPNLGFLVAHDQLYRDAGLDVTVPGRQRLRQHRTIGRRQGDADRLPRRRLYGGNGISKGIKTIASIFRGDPSAIMVLDDSPIKTPKDLEGRTLAMTAGIGQFQQWPAYVKGHGMDAAEDQNCQSYAAQSDRHSSAIRSTPVGSYVQSYVPIIEIRGQKKARAFWFSDYGVNVVSNGIIAHQDLIKSDPELIGAFVPASIKGFLYGRQHPDEAAATVKKYSETVDALSLSGSSRCRGGLGDA